MNNTKNPWNLILIIYFVVALLLNIWSLRWGTHILLSLNCIISHLPRLSSPILARWLFLVESQIIKQAFCWPIIYAGLGGERHVISFFLWHFVIAIYLTIVVCPTVSLDLLYVINTPHKINHSDFVYLFILFIHSKSPHELTYNPIRGWCASGKCMYGRRWVWYIYIWKSTSSVLCSGFRLILLSGKCDDESIHTCSKHQPQCGGLVRFCFGSVVCGVKQHKTWIVPIVLLLLLLIL